jgi:hypothetical protein
LRWRGGAGRGEFERRRGCSGTAETSREHGNSASAKQEERKGKELTGGSDFARAKKSFYEQRCVRDKETKFECAPHKIKDWDVL